MYFILECLKKTSPPVLIFAERKQDVDIIHEYLLLKVHLFFITKKSMTQSGFLTFKSDIQSIDIFIIMDQ